MAKFGQGGVAATPAPGAAPEMPAPQPAMAASPAAGGGLFGGGGGQGLFGSMDPKTRYDLTLSLLEGAMGGAAQSGSPLLAGLAPILGAMIGAKAEGRYGDARDAKNAEYAKAVGLPAGLEPLTGVLNDPDAPGYLTAAAEARLKAAMAPPKAARGGGGRRGGGAGGGSPGAGGEPLYGEFRGADGMLYGRTRRGVLMPYLGADGAPVPLAAAGGGAGAAKAAAEDPLGMLDAPADDPLGMR